MSNKTNFSFKKNKNVNTAKISMKNTEAYPFHIINQSVPKKVDYPNKIERYPLNTIPSENVIFLTHESNQSEKKNFEVIHEERNSKYTSPKIAKKSNFVSSSSNLPTANNSFHTVISSPEQDKFQDEYQYIAYSRNRKPGGKQNNRKVSNADSVDSLEYSELNSFSGGITTNNKKKSDDFKVKFKTEMCKFWELEAFCRYGDNCAFAHGVTEMRLKSEITNHYRTKKCKQFFDNGFCTYGNRCQFAHADKNYSNFSYKKLINLLSSWKKIEAIVTLSNNFLNRPRLTVFEKILKNNGKFSELSNANTLLDDVKNILQKNGDDEAPRNKCIDIQYINDTLNLQRGRILTL